MRSKKKKSAQGDEPDLGAVVCVENVTPAVLAHVFDLHGPHHNHYTGRPCKSPNCKTGIGEGGSSIFDEDKREQAVRDIVGIHCEEVDPRQLLRAAPGEPEYRASEPEYRATTGLHNLGATCFMNALFQVLFATEPFRQGVYQFRAPTVMPKGETRESLEARVRVIGELQLLFAKMQMSNRNWLNPDIFPKLLGFETGEQQDVQEFFMLLLAHYCDECFRMCEDTKSLFGDLFGVNQVVSIECGKCHNRSERRELFYVLQLPLRESVLESLSLGMQPEQLDGDNMYECGSCGVRTTATRSTRLQAPIAPVLVLQVIRFHYDVRQNNKIKRMAKVSAPRVLDMTPFVCNPTDVRESDLQYELYAVILHIGTSAHGGHYVAHALQDNGMWVEMDDQETRELLPGEVGLTYAMRKAAISKKRIEEDDADDFVEDVEMWEEEEAAGSNGNIKRRGREGGGGGGGGRTKKKGPGAVVVEDLERFTKGSPAPYLLFYRRRAHGWGRSVPTPPPYALAQVAKDNESLVRSHRDYNAVADEVYRELDELRELYENVIAEVDASKESCWLSLEWLKRWVAHEPTTERVPKVDNSALACPHDGVSPASLPLMKRISTEAWTALQRRYGGTPHSFMPSRRECRECVVEFCTRTQSSVQEEELAKHVKMELKNEPPLNSNFFYMSAPWLAQWKKNPKSEALEKHINGSLLCAHNCLVPHPEEFVRVTAFVWNYFQQRWRDAVVVSKKLRQCAECKQAEGVMEEYRQLVVVERRAFEEKLGANFAKRRTMYVVSALEPGEWKLLSKTWVDKYRQYLDDPEVELAPPPDNSDLFCEHNLLKVRLSEELQTDDKANPKPLRSVLLVSVAQLEVLAKTFGRPVGEVSVITGKDGTFESAIEECADCFESERLANAEFENQQITIRRGTGGRCTASGYHLRASKKPSARGAAASDRATQDFKVKTSASDTIYDLKLKICQFVEGVDPSSIALRLGDVLLENEFVLSSYGITPKSVIDMEVLLLDGVDGDDEDVAGDAAGRPRRQRPPPRDRKPEKGFQGSLMTKDFAVSSGSDDNDKATTGDGVQCAACTYVSRTNGDACEMCDTPFGAKNKRSKK